MQYGLARDFSERIYAAGLTVTSARATSRRNLVSKYGLSPAEATELRKCIDREPIDPEILNRLLLRSNFICSLCKGLKGGSYVVHHIVEYEKTQDNGYDNLIVVCPNDHDLAHQSGLTLQITADQLRHAKEAWEREVEIENAARAAQKAVVQSHTSATDYGDRDGVGVRARQAREILPLLRKKYPRYLRPEMASVRFVQSQDRCYLEITTIKSMGDYLADEVSTRTDLAFVSEGSGCFFRPDRTLDENVRRFMEDFNEVSIINCTDLFTEEMATRIDMHWRQFHTLPRDI